MPINMKLSASLFLPKSNTISLIHQQKVLLRHWFRSAFYYSIILINATRLLYILFSLSLTRLIKWSEWQLGFKRSDFSVKDISLNKFAAFVLLMTFLIGQFIVYSHEHPQAALHIVDSPAKKHQADHPKCAICDQNSHPQLVFNFTQGEFILPVKIVEFGLFIIGDQIVRSLISGNRGPPLYSFLC